jgi:hypothetical protein
MEELAKQGILLRRSVRGRWRRRFFVLDPGQSTLSYYHDQRAHAKGSMPLGSIHLHPGSHLDPYTLCQSK